MKSKEILFDKFISSVDKDLVDFIVELHEEFIKAGCSINIKEAKSGYVVSYLLNKKTVSNYVFRKKGIMVRIYANHINKYMEFLSTLPDNMVKDIANASICKRLINPEACNSRCAMGYDFMIAGEHYQKCRNNAFMFLICEENSGFIKSFLYNELAACSEK